MLHKNAKHSQETVFMNISYFMVNRHIVKCIELMKLTNTTNHMFMKLAKTHHKKSSDARYKGKWLTCY